MRRRVPMRFAKSDDPLICALCYRTLDAEENAYCRSTDACISRQDAVQQRLALVLRDVRTERG